ncbi:hypothetical protein AHF37_05440 [Paragonimus kellicotti]|nr:hypothetical protein AHF37_05440 [Paragonimus kellicotti]
MSFVVVFAVVFSGVTGIMNGANVSGELKNPARAIPLGTLGACLTTLIIYLVLAIFSAASCSRAILHYETGCQVGRLLRPATWTTKNGNPLVAVLVACVLAQVILLIGRLNAIAPLVSILFMLSYLSVNLACMLLDTASAANFRELMQQNYVYLQGINFWPPIIVIGVFATTLSAALGNLIGASRILEALARDELFGINFWPPIIVIGVFATTLSAALGNLIGASRILEALARDELFVFRFPFPTITVVPPKRPTFRYFNWFTALLGLIGCLIMCLLIQPIYTLIALVILIALVFVLHQRHLEYSWGNIGQALLFHQASQMFQSRRPLHVALSFDRFPRPLVRKYLLLLDARKDHVKYWRLQLLLLVSNPRSSASLVQFMNGLKKGGLYVIGHAIYADPTDSADGMDSTVEQRWYWTKYAQFLKVKAFVEVTADSSIRRAMSHLLRISGLGAMRPNTVCLGFYDDGHSQRSGSTRFYMDNTLELKSLFRAMSSDSLNALCSFSDTARRNADNLQSISYSAEGKATTSSGARLTPEDYVSFIHESLRLEWFHRSRVPELPSELTDSGFNGSTENAPRIVCRSPTSNVIKVNKSRSPFFDIWPVNLLNFVNQTPTHSPELIDRTGLFLLQLACLVARSPYWRSRRHPPLLRVFFPLMPRRDDSDESSILSSVSSAADLARLWLSRLLHDLRIQVSLLNCLKL